MNSELLTVLRGCLDPHTVHSSENRLKQISQNHDFTQQLLLLIPNQENQLLIMVLTTLKNYLMSRYNSNEGRISNEQKQILRGNLLQLYYQIKNNSNAVQLYKEILYIVIAVDYPWNGVQNYLMNDLNNSIQAGVYFCRQMAKVCEYFENEQRQKLQAFISQFFPRLEQIVEQILSNFNEATSRLLPEIFKTFYSSFHITIPVYLRNFQHIQRWMLFFNTIFNIPTDDLSAKSQEIAARCYLRFFSVYCNEGLDDKTYVGWAQQFREYFGLQLFEFIYQLVASRKGNENILSTLINCLHEVAKKEALRFLIKDQHIMNLFYSGVLFPLCESSRDQINMFTGDEIEYVRREDDLSCYPVRRAVEQLVEMSVNYLTFNQKPQLFRMVEYSASILSSNSCSQGEKEVVVRILTKIGKLILRNKYLKSQFQNLTVQYFLPLLRSNNKLINSLVCDLLSKYLPFGELSPQTVTALMELIYEKIVNQNSLVVRYYAILAFTALLGHGSALEAAKPHFSAILEIYVKTLNAFDHQNLIESLSSIVKHFDKEIVSFAPDLLPHLLRMFCSLAKNEQQTEEEDQPDSNTPAKAALSTVKEILNCPLDHQTYYNISIDLTDLLRGILGQYNEYFDQVLSLFAVLLHKAKNIADFEYPYAVCRKLLEGNNEILARSGVQGERLGELLKVQKADSQFEQSLLAILKNIIQKAPDQVLRNYPWPTHPQLILALIENRRIQAHQLGNLNTSEVDENWTPYLSAYSWTVFGVGSLGNLNQVHSILGVSLYPWLKEGVNPHLVKLVADAVEDDEEQQDLLEQNTAQLLQKYANEQDDEQQSYFQGSGKNYGFLYDSPFDSEKDRQMLVCQVRSLNQQAAVQLVNSLSNKYKKKLQILMTQNQ